jgi:hypothetical protein
MNQSLLTLHSFFSLVKMKLAKLDMTTGSTTSAVDECFRVVPLRLLQGITHICMISWTPLDGVTILFSYHLHTILMPLDIFIAISLPRLTPIVVSSFVPMSMVLP